MKNQTNNGTCPFCDHKFNKSPLRKTKCLHCHNFVYVRTYPDTRKKVLVTKERADEIQEIYNQRAVSSASRTQVLNFIHASNFDFENSKKILSAKFGSEPSENDVLWNLANQSLLNTQDHHTKQSVYHAMALIDHARGRDPFRHLVLSIQQNIYDHQAKGATHLEIMSKHCCDECKIFNGKVISVKNALSEMPLPVKKCSNHSGLCQCEYLYHVDMNEFKSMLRNK